MAKEGGLQAAIRHPLDWKSNDFWDEDSLAEELERVFDICHGCRRCLPLCQSFPQLFDLVDESDTGEVDGVEKADYAKVVDHCFLCDLCFQVKCPYVPPHEWNLDFPKLMLRAKAVAFRKSEGSTTSRLRNRILTSTDTLAATLSVPGVRQVVNATLRIPSVRRVMDATLAISKDATLPEYQAKSARVTPAQAAATSSSHAMKGRVTTGKVAIFATCYAEAHDATVVRDILSVYAHNDIQCTIATNTVCCGMPKQELGDLESVEKLMRINIPRLDALVQDGWDIVAPVPSCVLMFKTDLPLMFPDNEAVQRVASRVFDPVHYLMLRHKDGLLKTEFDSMDGHASYQVACHQRVQQTGRATQRLLELIPDLKVSLVERCSGHDGTYAIKAENRLYAEKIARRTAKAATKKDTRWLIGDCPLAVGMVHEHMDPETNHHVQAMHPVSFLSQAYGLGE